jgi:DNA processing protein
MRPSDADPVLAPEVVVDTTSSGARTHELPAGPVRVPSDPPPALPFDPLAALRPGPNAEAPPEEAPAEEAGEAEEAREAEVDPAGELPEEAYAACLAGLTGMGPARLAAIMRAEGAAEAWRRVAAGRGWTHPEVVKALGQQRDRLVERWQREARAVEVAEVWHRIVAEGVGVAVLGSAAYPRCLAADIEAPAILFHRGSPEVIAGPRVAIVGTRRCTATGVSVALELGRDLTEAGVSVVSGLATGIDAAAHRGALVACRHAGPAFASGSSSDAPGDRAAAPIGVAANGLDIVYPRGHAELWHAVASAGVLLSETPLGCRPERWRFPARNRIIAALADLVVVVESHRRGGSLYTVDEAERRGIDVLAVPGSVRNPAAGGTNALIADGRAPVTSVEDVLIALGLQPAGRRARVERRPPPADGDKPVLDALGWQPATLDQLVLRTGRDLGSLVLALDRLDEGGWVARRGGWYERVVGGEP